MRNVICAIAKNENNYINDWCNYHLELGFNHIYIFDNNDSTTKNINNFIDNTDKVTIFNINDIHEDELQNKCYTKFYSEHSKDFDWCAFIDIDEFINIKNNSIEEFLNQSIFNNFEMIRLQWHSYGDDDVIERDTSIPVYKYFKKQLKDESINKWCKCIVKGNLSNIAFTSSHFASRNKKLLKQCLATGKETNCEKATNIVENAPAWINHYVTKTLDEFLNQKFGRTNAQFKNQTINCDYFWKINKKTKEKENYINKFINKDVKYVIMCGGNYTQFSTPKQTLKILGERIIDRTLRLLIEEGIDKNNIVITISDPAAKQFYESCGVDIVLNKNNSYKYDNSSHKLSGYWVDAFVNFNTPTCYIFGDVFYSNDCIKKIVESYSNDIQFFGTAKPFALNYIKTHVEPLCFKVYNLEKFFKNIDKCKELQDAGKFWRFPIAWDLWAVIKNVPTEYDYFKKQTADIFGDNYIPIYDYTCDVDGEKDIDLIENALKEAEREVKPVFGIISWFPDKEPERTQRINRLNKTFEQINNIFGDVDYLIIAQNWKNYSVPEYVKNNATICNYNKLGILGARKKLGQHFLDSPYDYLIMCDDDIILETDDNFTKEYFFNELNKHPDGFMFLKAGWSLTFCAISKYIYKQTPMIDIDPEKGEGYEDTTYFWLLHYKYLTREFKLRGINFLQNQKEYHENHKSTWGTSKTNHKSLNEKTKVYVNAFEQGKFDITNLKKLLNSTQFEKEREWYEKAKWWGWISEEQYNEFKRKYGL